MADIYSHVYRVWNAPKKKATKFKPLTAKHIPTVVASRPGALDYKQYASSTSDGVALLSERGQKYEGEMAEREKVAREEIEYKKTCVAIPYNKGAYQYVTEGMDPKNFGRK